MHRLRVKLITSSRWRI